MGLIIGGVSAHDLILDGQSVSLYAGGSPPVKLWPTREKVQITLDALYQARDQLRAALSDRGLDYWNVTEIPFDIDLVGAGSTQYMFQGCSSLTSVPDMDTAQVTNMRSMFDGCSSLTSVPDMDTAQVTDMYGMFVGCSSLAYVPDMDTSQATNMSYMFYNCAALTDGNVRLIGRHPQVDTTGMILNSGLTREPFFDAAGNPLPPPEEVHQVSLTNVAGQGTVHPLVSVTVPAGQVWDVQIQGTVTNAPSGGSARPQFRIGSSTSGSFATGASVNFSGTVSSTNATIAMVTNILYVGSSFTGTVTIEK